MRKRISVIGGGSWATAIVKILNGNNHEVNWWLRSREDVEFIKRFGHNPKYLSSVSFNLDLIKAGTELHACVENSEYVILVVPSAYLEDTLAGSANSIFNGKKIISAIKGVAPGNHILVSEYLEQEFGVDPADMAHISGPCHAEEVAAEKLSYLTFASQNLSLAQELAALFANRYLSATACDDMIGTEYAAILKNVYAIAAGISVGLGYGDNFRAVLISHAMTEMAHFIGVMHTNPRNILNPAYLGDTLVTCYSPHSRNRTFGVMVGKGYTSKSAALELGMVAEGYYSAEALHRKLTNHGLTLPIAESVYHILYSGDSAEESFRKLAYSFGNMQCEKSFIH